MARLRGQQPGTDNDTENGHLLLITSNDYNFCNHFTSFIILTCFYHVRYPKGKDVVNMLQLRELQGCKAMPNGPIRAKQVNPSSAVIGRHGS